MITTKVLYTVLPTTACAQLLDTAELLALQGPNSQHHDFVNKQAPTVGIARHHVVAPSETHWLHRRLPNTICFTYNTPACAVGTVLQEAR